MNYIGMPKYNSFIWKIHPHSNADGVFSSQIRLVTSTYSRNSALLLLQILFCLERKSLKPRYMCTCMLGSNEILSLNKHKNSASLFHCFMNINTSHKPKLLGSDHVQMTEVFLRFCLQSTLVI